MYSYGRTPCATCIENTGYCIRLSLGLLTIEHYADYRDWFENYAQLYLVSNLENGGLIPGTNRGRDEKASKELKLRILLRYLGVATIYSTLQVASLLFLMNNITGLWRETNYQKFALQLFINTSGNVLAHTLAYFARVFPFLERYRGVSHLWEILADELAKAFVSTLLLSPFISAAIGETLKATLHDTDNSFFQDIPSSTTTIARAFAAEGFWLFPFFVTQILITSINAIKQLMASRRSENQYEPEHRYFAWMDTVVEITAGKLRAIFIKHLPTEAAHIFDALYPIEYRQKVLYIFLANIFMFTLFHMVAHIMGAIGCLDNKIGIWQQTNEKQLSKLIYLSLIADTIHLLPTTLVASIYYLHKKRSIFYCEVRGYDFGADLRAFAKTFIFFVLSMVSLPAFSLAALTTSLRSSLEKNTPEIFRRYSNKSIIAKIMAAEAYGIGFLASVYLLKVVALKGYKLANEKYASFIRQRNTSNEAQTNSLYTAATLDRPLVSNNSNTVFFSTTNFTEEFSNYKARFENYISYQERYEAIVACHNRLSEKPEENKAKLEHIDLEYPKHFECPILNTLMNIPTFVHGRTYDFNSIKNLKSDPVTRKPWSKNAFQGNLDLSSEIDGFLSSLEKKLGLERGLNTKKNTGITDSIKKAWNSTFSP